MDVPWPKYILLRLRRQRLSTARRSETAGFGSWSGGSGSGSVFTFRDLVHPEAADKRFRVLLSQANRVLYGHRWHKKGEGIRWVRALEYQKRDVIHYHALMAGVQDLRRLTWMDRWHELAGYARIESIESAAAVARYVSKYVVKGGEIDLGGPLVPSELPLFLQAASRPDG